MVVFKQDLQEFVNLDLLAASLLNQQLFVFAYQLWIFSDDTQKTFTDIFQFEDLGKIAALCSIHLSIFIIYT